MKTKVEHIYDELLVFRCQDGDKQALTVLIERWQPGLLNHAAVITGDRDSAKDIVQDSWIAIIKGIYKLKDPALFAAWAYRIVNNKSVDYFRRQKSQRVLVELMPGSAEALSGMQESEEVAIQEILKQMPEHHRSVIALHYLQGFEVSDIALILEIPEGTVKSRLYNGRERFRKLMENDDER